MSKPKSLDIAKFLKIAGMLSSPTEQERATAAKITTELLSASGFTWEQILQAGANRLAIPQKNHPGQPAPSAVPQEVNDFFSNLFKSWVSPATFAINLPSPLAVAQAWLLTVTLCQQRKIRHQGIEP
jgi:hypothetical protein